MTQAVGFGLSQIHPWENLLKEVFESFEVDIIEDIITSFNYLADDYEDDSASDDIEDDDIQSFDLQKRFYHALNRGNDKLRSAKYLRNVMRIKDLHHDGEPMVDRVTGVIDQLKEHESQEEIKANEIFVGRDRDIQLILGLLCVHSGLTKELSREDLDFIRKQSPRVKGVYLSGIGGQGKTTLARKVCDSLSDAHEPWESVMISLRNRNSFEEVLQAVLSELGVLLTIHVTSRENLQNHLLEFIRTTEQNILICLDDCDAVDRYSMKEIGNIFVKMGELHTQRKVKFLLTSRAKFDEKGKEGKYEVKLGGNLVELELDSLTDDEAIDLLRRCSDVHIDELDDEKAHSIVTCCSLSPLAVTMVAQMLKEGKFTPQQLLFHLKKDEKHATKAMKINKRVAEVFDKLDVKLRASVVHLSVFQASKFDLKSARRILDLDKSEMEKEKVKEILQSLHDYHFLEVFTKERKDYNLDPLTTEVRGNCHTEYSLHPLVYRFIAEQLKEGPFRDFRSHYNEAVLRFVDLMEGKTARIYKMLSTKCKKGIAAMEENKVHIMQYYDFMLEENIKNLLAKYPKTVKSKFVLLKKNVSDMTDLILHDAKKRRLFLSEARRAAESRCDAMEIFWMVERAYTLLKRHQKPDLALKLLDELSSGRFAALRNLHDQPDYPPLVMALYHKVKGQAFWKLLKHDVAMQHLRLSEHFYDIRDERDELMLRPTESYRVLKAKLLKSKGLLLLDLKKLGEGETALQKAYALLEEQVYVKNERNENAIRVRELKKLSIQIPEFFTHFGAIQIEKARLEKNPDGKNKLLNKALEYLDEGMELDKQLHIDSLDDFAAKMKLCADVYIEQGLYDEAEQYASSAERQRRHCLQLPHINVTESVYQKGKIFILKGLEFLEKGNKKHGKHYLRCAEDWFGELESDHLINGSIPTVNHPLYAAIKVDHLELYRLLDNKKKLKKLVQFYTDIETGKYDETMNRFKEQFQSMMYTPEEVLDQMYAGGGQQFGDNDNLMIQVEPEDFEGAGRDRADSGRGGSSIDSALSSMSEGGSLIDSISRMNIQKSLSLEDEVLQRAPGTQKRTIKRQKTVSDD